MCGIIGYWSSTPKDSHFDAIKRLFVQSKIRGLHSFGYSYFTDGQIVTVKEHKLDDVLRSLDQLKTIRPRQLIGHTRYSTSGDYLDHTNNQPIVLGGITLVFNGVIDMRARQEWAKDYGGVFETDNDGEIFLRHIQNGGCPVKFLASKRCSFAGLYFQDGQMSAIRNAFRPMWMSQYEGATLIASTRDIFERAIGVEAKQISPLKLFDLEAISLNLGLEQVSV